MEPKSRRIRRIFIRFLLFGVSILLLCYVYVVTVFSTAGDGVFSVFSGGGGGRKVFVLGGSEDPALRRLWTSREWRKAVDYHSSVFQDLIVEGFLSPTSKTLSVSSGGRGQDVFALREIGVPDSIGVSNKPFPPLVASGHPLNQPFDDDTFDFAFVGRGSFEKSTNPPRLASEIGRVLKPEGFVAVHTASAGDHYSFNSLLDIFNCCRLVRSREIDGLGSSALREVVLQKREPDAPRIDADSVNTCSVPDYKRELVRSAEPLIMEEPLKPWITLKKNIKNIKYLPSIVDISFKRRYVYVDVGSRSYGSSIVSWFKKQYPKNNRTFEIYAIEADPAFHAEYKTKKGVTLLPYAAWVRNETLQFEINGDPDKKHDEKGGRGMGRIRPSESSSDSTAAAIPGFDFAEWLRSTVSETDYVVMKMDVEGTEFDLIPRLFETGAICLIDELFLECHYNRWQRCCPGERSSKYEKMYWQCLELFSSLRESGILVHQWW
ncbi:hypothetical protein QJS10_CPA07g01219 [Acorus calamus]|uniref:Methyltransferase type 11 domain-containing protein n=1 Tax=Acorus calamus TaxID=4465 RepID=A0AAV9EFA7_ACOCL|nr:hypothetical protein QJS10_CPA07g01219 [Acorus calamus]